MSIDIESAPGRDDGPQHRWGPSPVRLLSQAAVSGCCVRLLNACSVAVRLGLERPRRVHVEVLGLLVGELRQLHAEGVEV